MCCCDMAEAAAQLAQREAAARIRVAHRARPSRGGDSRLIGSHQAQRRAAEGRTAVDNAQQRAALLRYQSGPLLHCCSCWQAQVASVLIRAGAIIPSYNHSRPVCFLYSCHCRFQATSHRTPVVQTTAVEPPTHLLSSPLRHPVLPQGCLLPSTSRLNWLRLRRSSSWLSRYSPTWPRLQLPAL